MAMEPPPPFRLSPLKSQPLHTLSPERLNAARTISTATTATKTSWTNETDADVFPPPREPSSTHSSPTRRANLFADYHPATPNKSTTGFALPQSPSLPEIHALRSHVRTNSDVHGLVKRFEHLDVRDKDAESADRRRKHEAELRRAQIAREEAESDVRRLREELRHVKKESEDGRERERKVGRRLEVVMVGHTHGRILTLLQANTGTGRVRLRQRTARLTTRRLRKGAPASTQRSLQILLRSHQVTGRAQIHP